MEHFLIIISILDFNILRSFNWSLCYGINCSGCFFLLSLSWHLMRENRPPFVIFFFVWFYRRLFENEMMEISCGWIEAASFRDALRLSGSLGRLLFCFAIVWGFFAIFFFFFGLLWDGFCSFWFTLKICRSHGRLCWSSRTEIMRNVSIFADVPISPEWLKTLRSGLFGGCTTNRRRSKSLLVQDNDPSLCSMRALHER